MSIASLSRARSIRQRSPQNGDSPDGAAAALAPPEDDESKKTISDALSAVAAYIPSEILAIYTLVIAMTVTGGGAVGADGKVAAATLPMWAFYAFLGAVAPFTWLIYAVSEVEEERPTPWSPKTWPYWEAVAAMVSFAAWSAALPKSALLRYSWFSAPVAAIALVMVSLTLPLVGVLVTKKKRA